MDLFALILFGLLSGDLVFETSPPPTPVIRDAIRRLAPHRVSPRRARHLARIIQREAKRRKIDVFLLVSFIHEESDWNPRLRSKTNDFGLTQVHVAARGSATFLGREAELYDPQTNIREWARLAAMWRGYHQRECEVRVKVCYGGADGKPWSCTMELLHPADHPWWSHLKWGYKVKKGSPSTKKVTVEGTYRWLLEQFYHVPETS
jgi:hypothetical protein